MPELEMLRRQVVRERTARKQAEAILEEKARQLWEKNIELQNLNKSLENIVQERTLDLEINQTRFVNLISNLQSGILLEDENGQILLTNDAFCKLFNLRNDTGSLIGKSAREVDAHLNQWVLEDLDFLETVNELRTQRKIVVEDTLVLNNQTILERDFVPIFSGKNYLGILWLFRDVTERWKASEKLRLSEEKYRGIMENMELGLLEVDLDQNIVRAYDRFCSMVGYSESELIGKNAAAMLLPTEFKNFMEEQAKDREQGKASIYEVQLLRSDGTRIWALISGAPIFSSDGEIVGSLGIHYDISNIKNLQEQLISAKARAEEAEELEKQFLANMSHEMRTPLNAIVGMAHLLYDTNPSAEQKDFLDVLRNSADMLLGIISDVLDISKIRSGKIEISPVPMDLGGLVRSLHKTFRTRLQNSPVEIFCNIDPHLDTILEGDELLLNQILMNLLGNAVKFTKTGRIDLRVAILEKNESGVSVQFSVTDTGIGIPVEKQKLIFQAFRQVDGNIKRQYGGTGLGLTITKRLVEIQGGTIRVSSKPEKGTRFTVELTFKDTERPIEEFKKGISSSEKLNMNGHTILIVEDNPMNQKYITTLLNRWNLPYHVAWNGVEGVKKAKEQQYGLIFMDIQMPEMDGYETTIAIRSSINPNTESPIIALTASAMLSNKDKAFTAGMTDYLSKPFTPEQLFEKIQQYSPTKSEITPQASSTLPEEGSNFIDELYGGDVEYAAEMFQIFMRDMLPKFAEFEEFIAAEDSQKIAKLAHLLKPSLAMIGQNGLHDDLDAIETEVAQNSDFQYIVQKYRAFYTTFQEKMPAIMRQFTTLPIR